MHIQTFIKNPALMKMLILVSVFGTQFFSMSAHADEVTTIATDLPTENTPSSQSLTLTIGDQTEVINANQMIHWFAVQSNIQLAKKYTKEIESTHACPISHYYCDFAISQNTQRHFKNNSNLLPREDALQSFVQELNSKIAKDPVDAKFALADNRISTFSLSKDGVSLDIDSSVELLKKTITSKTFATTPATISLPIITTKPKIAANEGSDLGIVELIGEGHTNFAGSPKNRVHNFKRAIEQFNGVLLAPQQEFSFVDYLGDVDGEHGYLPELVIKKDKTEPEFGGGICQVSSTVFRAAVYSGLKITARRNHAYPVKYYAPYGMDATIYIPRPDLKFVNNTPRHILMQADIEGTILSFKFYGTSDGRKTVVDGPHILESNPDGSMKTTFTQTVTTATGETLINDEFKSNYASPSKYPHPGQEQKFTSKPKDWSHDQWQEYKRANNL